MKTVNTSKLIGRVNAYYPNLAKPFGGVSVAVLFSQLFYWQDKATSQLGVYKTRDELKEETGLTHNEQRTAIKKLESLGILIVTEKRLEHKTFYKIDTRKMNEVLANFAEATHSTPRLQQSISPEIDNVKIEMREKSSSYYQENTTKITTETTTNIDIVDKPQKPKRATHFENNFKPNNYHNNIAKELNIDLNSEFIKFKDYCLANGKKYVDWDAGFNNWLRNVSQFHNKIQTTNQQFMTRSERNRAVLNSMRGE